MLDGVFTAPVPSVDGELCLNNRHGGVQCVRCVTGCPVMAVGFVEPHPEIHSDACVSCGVCVALCPTDAISLPRGVVRALGEALARSDAVGLVCPYHPDPGSSAVPVESVVRHGMCLGSLDASRLVSLGAERVWLDLSYCGECPIGSVSSWIVWNANAVNALCSARGDEPVVSIARDEGDSRRVRVVDGSYQGIRKRDMFSLRRSGPAREPMVQRGATGDARLPQSLPESRRRLLDWLGDGSADSSVEAAVVPFAAVEVDPGLCSACEVCARFCPTGALAFHSDGGSFALGFQVPLCIDCGICVPACPEDAISYGAFIDGRRLLEREWAVVAEGELVECAVCRTPTRKSSTTTCYSCRAGTVDSLRDDAGLMADFLGRADRASKEGGPEE